MRSECFLRASARSISTLDWRRSSPFSLYLPKNPPPERRGPSTPPVAPKVALRGFMLGTAPGLTPRQSDSRCPLYNISHQPLQLFRDEPLSLAMNPASAVGVSKVLRLPSTAISMIPSSLKSASCLKPLYFQSRTSTPGARTPSLIMSINLIPVAPSTVPAFSPSSGPSAPSLSPPADGLFDSSVSLGDAPLALIPQSSVPRLAATG